jgi:hypothetical protein
MKDATGSLLRLHPSMAGSDTAKTVAGRRTFLRIGLLTSAAAALAASPAFTELLRTVQASTPDLVHDTYSGLLAFIVPGPDAYSVAQGLSTPEAGGIDTGVLDILITVIDESAPYLPQFSAILAGILNNLAQAVNPAAAGPFSSPFANLSFPEKVAVFQIMDGTEALKYLAGVLPAIVAFLCYSDAAVLDPATRTLTGQPVGWTISNYSGVADGRAEFRGYFGNRRTED